LTREFAEVFGERKCGSGLGLNPHLRGEMWGTRQFGMWGARPTNVPGAKARVVVRPIMSGLKPGPISEARTNMEILAFDFAQARMTNKRTKCGGCGRKGGRVEAGWGSSGPSCSKGALRMTAQNKQPQVLRLRVSQ